MSSVLSNKLQFFSTDPLALVSFKVTVLEHPLPGRGIICRDITAQRAAVQRTRHN